MIKSEYKVLKKLLRKFPDEFGDNDVKYSEQLLKGLAKEGWLSWHAMTGVRKWSVTHKAREDMRTFERETASDRSAKLTVGISFLALLVSIVGLFTSVAKEIVFLLLELYKLL